MRRLTEALAAPSSTIRGQVQPDWLRLERRIAYRNSFQPRLVGKMRDCQAGTCLSISIGMSPAIWVFLGFWVLMLGPLALGIDVQTAGDLLRSGRTDMRPLALGITGMLFFAVVLTLVGRFLGRSDHAQLLGFLRTVTLTEERPE